MPVELSSLLSDSDMNAGGDGSSGPSSSLSDLSESGGIPSQKFLRSFCRYCHSHPFYCGEMLQLCYAKA